MTSFERIEEIKQNHEALKLQFVMTELEMAITFCGVAKSTDSGTTARRNIENAERARESAAKAISGMQLNPKEGRTIEKLLKQVEEALAECAKLTKLEHPQNEDHGSTGLNSSKKLATFEDGSGGA